MDSEIKRALETLKAGGIILYPTDTVWGLGCDATNSNAVEKIFRIKKRNESKSLIVLLDQDIKLNKYVKEVPALAWDLIEFSDKPLTIVYDNVTNMAHNAIAADGSAAIRITKDEFCKKLIYKLGKPLISTSANISGEVSPANFGEIDGEILRQVDYIVGLRQHEKTKSVASSIIKLKNNGEVSIIRK
jgi:L-threonylcarbamoyladenylate synthase